MKVTKFALLAATALAVVVTGSAATTASADPATTVQFTNHLDVMSPVDVAPAGPSVGDQFYIDSHVVSGDVTGRTSAACVLVKAHGGGLRQCEIDFLLSNGTITTRGLVTGPTTTQVRLVVTGGKGAYVGASGAGTLTPTPDGSVVDLRLR